MWCTPDSARRPGAPGRLLVEFRQEPADVLGGGRVRRAEIDDKDPEAAARVVLEAARPRRSCSQILLHDSSSRGAVNPGTIP